MVLAGQAMIVASAAAANLLVNGGFDSPPMLGAGQSSLAVGQGKMIITNSSVPGYASAISGITNWTYALPNNGGAASDHGLSRSTGFGDAGGNPLAYINNWNRMMSQTVTNGVAGFKAEAKIQFGTLGSASDGGRAGTFYLVAGEADPANPDNFSARSVILQKLVVGNPTFKSAQLNQVVANGTLTNLTLSYSFTNGAAGVGLPLTVAFRTEWASVGPTYWDNASLTVTAQTNDPFVVREPQGLVVDVPASVALNVVGGGTQPLTYQWRRNGTVLTNDGNIAGAQTSTLSIQSVMGADAGAYSVVLSNALGVVTSAVAPLLVNVNPIISTQAVGGLAVDTSGNVYVAEPGLNDVRVYSPAGGVLRVIGTTGTGAGQLRGPTDVAVFGGSVYVVDCMNERVQQFTTSGTFVQTIGGPGRSAGAFALPNGCATDGSGRLYVADSGNHRVQRFLANGSLDSSWGGLGVVGLGVLRRDHTGFDCPSDVAINPVNQQVYVADYGNCRLEVFDTAGTYIRTYYAIYHPAALSFAANGDLFIAGDDPNEGYPPYDGRVRYLKFGDELVSRHYYGGLDDLSRILRGVCVAPGGSVLISDALNSRIVRADPSFVQPIDNLHLVARGNTVEFRWQSTQAHVGAVRFGTTSNSTNQVVEASSVTNHAITVSGLTPNTRLFYTLGFADTFDAQRRWTAVDVINTGCLPGQHQFLRVKAAGLIYTDAQVGPGYTRMNDADLLAARVRMTNAAAFYWRNSGFKLWPDIQILEINRDVTETPYSVWDSAQTDLAALGFSAADDFDAVWASCIPAGGNFGGSGTLFGRGVAMCEWTSQHDFVAIHEINHTIDSMYATSGLPKYQFNHGIWAVPGGFGQDFTVNGQILRNMLPDNLTATIAPYSKFMTAPDADNDGVPDSSPAGLLNPLAVTEQTLGSSPSLVDTDGDGLPDATEVMALTAHGASPTNADSDGDGVTDGNDLNPLYRVHDHIMKGSPTVDGLIATNEGWTTLSSGWGFTNDVLVSDLNNIQTQCSTYAAWDNNYLYLAFKGPACTSTIRLDGSADNWFFGADNYLLTLNNGFASQSVQINVGVPDLFRQIDDDGQYSEFFDTNPQWLLPYQGRHFYDQPSEGAGYPSRLVIESDLIYARGGTGTNQAWEVAIPWSSKTSFRGAAGKRMALQWDAGGDQLFETDSAAVIILVDSLTANSPRLNYTANAVQLEWTTVPGVQYGLWVSESVIGPWRFVQEVMGQGTGTRCLDDGTLTGAVPASVPARFYRLVPQK